MIEVKKLKNGCYCSFSVEGQDFTIGNLQETVAVLNYIGWRHFTPLADVLKSVLSDSEMANLHQYKEHVQSNWKWKSLAQFEKQQSEWEHQQSILREKQAADQLAWEEECKERKREALNQEKEKSGGVPLYLDPDSALAILTCLGGGLG